jgi:hypothetical protein
MMKLAAEKNLNKLAFPLFSIKGRNIVNPCSVSYSTFGFSCEQGEFGPKNWTIMDILGTYFIHLFYNTKEGKIEFHHKIPTQNDPRVKQKSSFGISYKLLQFLAKEMRPITQGIIPDAYYNDNANLRDIDSSRSRMKKVINVTFTDDCLKEQILFLKRYSSQQVAEMFRKTSECLIRINLPVRFFDGNNYQNFAFNNYHLPCRLFTLSQVKNSKVSSDGHILEREYSIKFDTFFGYFYAQNCVSCYVDLPPDKFYLMSDYAQLFYRMLILPYFNNIKNPIGIEEIRRRLVLKTKDKYMVRQVVKRILDELEGNSFIKEPVVGESRP